MMASCGMVTIRRKGVGNKQDGHYKLALYRCGALFPIGDNMEDDRGLSVTKSNDEIIEDIAKAMLDNLLEQPNGNHGCLFKFIPTSTDNVCVDGHLDLKSLARSALEELYTQQIISDALM